MAKYTLEPDDQTLLEEVFNLAQRMVDLQMHDDTAGELQELLNASADAFGITQSEVHIEDDGKGNITISFAESEAQEPEKPRWTPTVITNEEPKPKPEG